MFNIHNLSEEIASEMHVAPEPGCTKYSVRGSTLFCLDPFQMVLKVQTYKWALRQIKIYSFSTVVLEVDRLDWDWVG